jgi:hypothetical protein
VKEQAGYEEGGNAVENVVVGGCEREAGDCQHRKGEQKGIQAAAENIAPALLLRRQLLLRCVDALEKQEFYMPTELQREARERCSHSTSKLHRLTLTTMRISRVIPNQESMRKMSSR